MRTSLGLFVSLALVCACSKQDSGGAPAAASAASSAQAPATPARVDVGFPSGVKMSPPKPKQIGAKTITADVCKLDKRGSDMKNADFAKAIRALAPAPDGGVYVVDGDGNLRKYLVQSASPCELALDTKFGQAGVLALDPEPKKADEYNAVQIDSAGTLYASGYSKVKQIAPNGQVTTICGDSGQLVVDRVTNDMYFNRKKVTVNGAKCDGADMKYTGWPGDNGPEIVDATNGSVFVKGSVTPKGSKDSIDKVGVYKPDGTNVALVGDKSGDGDICYTAGAQSCGLGLCVYDSNCRSLRVWAADGSKLVGVADLNELFGVSYAWPVDFVVLKDTSWVAFAQQGEGDKAPNYGFIARISGLE